MSFTLEIRGQTNEYWPLTTGCLRDIEKIRETTSGRAIDVLFGDEKTQDGTLRTVPRTDLLDAVKQIALEAKKMPGGFQMRIPPMYEGMKSTVGGGGVSGLLIDGKYYAIKCYSDHWTFREVGERRQEATPRYDTAEIATENFGVIKVWPKKLGRSDFTKVASEIQEFLEGDPSEEVQVIWG